MLRRILCALAALLLFAGGLSAFDAKVVSYDKGKLVVLVDGKEKTYELKPAVHVHDVDGKEVKPKDRDKVLTRDAVIDIEEQDGKVVEINVKKKS